LGKVERREQPEPEPIVSAPSTGVPTSDLDERLRQAEPGLLAVVIAAAQRGSWQAAMCLLEAINPELGQAAPPAHLAPPPPGEDVGADRPLRRRAEAERHGRHLPHVLSDDREADYEGLIAD
jgi:hypothetical protein